MIPLLILGVALILFGLILCTDKAERYWQNQSPKVTRKPLRPLPQPGCCQDCGLPDDHPLQDGLPLDDERRCWLCADLQQLRYIRG